ncbi:hypothetical protein H6G36_29230 [Anabaena minutissima FACHB-250]|nr:hypothetical protein [Anabaena minutissima FACHB-250]
MPISNPASVAQLQLPTATTGTEVSNSLSDTSSVLAAANTNRKGLAIYNTLSQTVYIDVANTVSESNYWFKLEAGAFYEMPEPIYTGIIYAMLATGTGSVEVREFV